MRETFHSGEKQIQKITGEEAAATVNGRIIMDTIVKGAINFIEKQPMVILSSADEQGRVWISILIGNPGFVRVPDAGSLSFHLNLLYSPINDIFFANMEGSAAVGSLFIELATRRRYRVNGNAVKTGENMALSIVEAYPNCPQYIQRRVISLPDYFTRTTPVITTGEKLNTDIQEWIQNADTMFVGSRGASGVMDASHRGGMPGFIHVLENGQLKIPDYHGNSMFNTLGNFVQDPNAGLLFIDFEKRQTLQLTGKATLLFHQQSEDDMDATTCTGRYWLFDTDAWIRTENHHLVNWEFVDYSPFNP